jgi:mannosyltransferase
MIISYLGFWTGVALMVAGILVPSSSLIESIRTVPAHLADQLLTGATLLRIGVVILGLIAVVLSRVSIGQTIRRREGVATNHSSAADTVILTIILLAASALRLYDLDAGLWHDEILTYVKFARMPAGEIISTYDTQNQNFLYSLLVRACFGIFGDDAWSLRLPAVMFGVASIWAMYFFARQAVNKREALLAAALLTFSYHHIWFSQNARGYTGLLFWTLLSSGLFLMVLREGRLQLWLAYAVSSAFGVYTQMTMVFVIVSHLTAYGTTLFVRRRETWPDRWTGLFVGFGLTGFLILLLHALVLPQVLSTVVGQESTVPAWKNPLWTLLELYKGLSVGMVDGAVAVIALGVFCLGLWSIGRTNGLFLQLLFVPPLLCAAINMAMGHHLWPRFFFFTFGFGALVVVRGTMFLGQLMTRFLKLAPAKSITLGTVLCAGLIVASALSVRSAYAPKQDFKGALEFVISNSEPGDAIATAGLATFTYQNLYKVNWKSVDSLEALNAVRAGAKRTWLLYTFPTHMAAVYPDIMAAIQSDFGIVKRFPGTVGDGTVFVARSIDRRS